MKVMHGLIFELFCGDSEIDFHFSTVFVAVDPLPLANKGFAAKPSLIWRRGSQNTHRG